MNYPKPSKQAQFTQFADRPMRKVQVFKYEQRKCEDNCVRSFRVEDFIGTFHQFGVGYEELDGGVGNFTTMVIERDDGTITDPPLQMCQFIQEEL